MTPGRREPGPSLGGVALELCELVRGQRARRGGAGDSTDTAAPACVFCAIMDSDEQDDVRHVLWTGRFTVALLNAYPYCPGHVMVLPIRHIRDLDSKLGPGGL